MYNNNVSAQPIQQHHQPVKRVNTALINTSPVTQQPKIMTRKVPAAFHHQQHTSSFSQQTAKCFVCDEGTINSLTASITEISTTTTQTKLPNKIAKIVGDSYMVIVGQDDVICRRCLGLLNQMDKIESELDRVKNSIKNFLNKKYSMGEEDQPPAKLQKLNSGRFHLELNDCLHRKKNN